MMDKSVLSSFVHWSCSIRHVASVQFWSKSMKEIFGILHCKHIIYLFEKFLIFPAHIDCSAVKLAVKKHLHWGSSLERKELFFTLFSKTSHSLEVCPSKTLHWDYIYIFLLRNDLKCYREKCYTLLTFKCQRMFIRRIVRFVILFKAR